MVLQLNKEDEEIYYIPLTLPSITEVKITDGSKTTVEVDGNYLLIPVVEDDEIEIERVCISDFGVKEIKGNGQVVLVGEVNPAFAIAAANVVIRAVKAAAILTSLRKHRDRTAFERHRNRTGKRIAKEAGKIEREIENQRSRQRSN